MATASMNAAVTLELKKADVSSTRDTKVPTGIILLQMCHGLKEVKQLHGQMIVSGLIHHPLNPRRLVESYVSTSHFDYALSVFESIPFPDVFAYNTMMRGLMLSEFPDESLLLYHKLLSNGLKPDNHTYTFVLKTCSHLKALPQGKQVHGQIVKAGIMKKPNDHIHSSLIYMYSNCGCIESAEQVVDENAKESILAMNSMITGYFKCGHFEKAKQMFDKMSKKDTATWSAMITGYAKNNNMHAEALSIFQEMMASKVPLNESTLVSAVCACAHLGALDQGRWIHRYVEKNNFRIGVSLGTALVDMYAKCGCIDFGYEVFTSMSRKDVVTWGVMISGFSMNGQAKTCFELFDEMVESGIIPNEIIFVAILSACSHTGCVQMGFHYFNEMVQRFRIKPSIEHYGCMVDLLGRAGRLEDAEELISSMSEKPNAVIWGALLSACRIHKDVKRGEYALMQLVQLEPTFGKRYKLARNLFASTGTRETAAEGKWRLAEYKDLDLATSGLSIIEVAGDVHQFIVGDINHSNTAEIYETLNGKR